MKTIIGTKTKTIIGMKTKTITGAKIITQIEKQTTGTKDVEKMLVKGVKSKVFRYRD